MTSPAHVLPPRSRRGPLLVGALIAVLAATVAPARSVTPWKPANISSPLFESHAAFDPLTGDLYFVRSSPQFSGWRIFVSHPTPSGYARLNRFCGRAS
jgi:hypothetical protein